MNLKWNICDWIKTAACFFFYFRCVQSLFDIFPSGEFDNEIASQEIRPIQCAMNSLYHPFFNAKFLLTITTNRPMHVNSSNLSSAVVNASIICCWSVGIASILGSKWTLFVHWHSISRDIDCSVQVDNHFFYCPTT